MLFFLLKKNDQNRSLLSFNRNRVENGRNCWSGADIIQPSQKKVKKLPSGKVSHDNLSPPIFPFYFSPPAWFERAQKRQENHGHGFLGLVPYLFFNLPSFYKPQFRSASASIRYPLSSPRACQSLRLSLSSLFSLPLYALHFLCALEQLKISVY